MDIHYTGDFENSQKRECYFCDFTELLASINVNIIAAVGNRGEIGNNGELLCQLPKDMQRFKELTFGHTIIMGRKTWDSLPVKPLPGRRNIVISHNINTAFPLCERFSSPAEAMTKLERNEDVFVIGGAEIFKEFLPHTKTIYLTRILSDFDADVFFPEIDWKKWHLIEDVFVGKDEENPYDCRFQKWEK